MLIVVGFVGGGRRGADRRLLADRAGRLGASVLAVRLRASGARARRYRVVRALGARDRLARRWRGITGRLARGELDAPARPHARRPPRR